MFLKFSVMKIKVTVTAGKHSGTVKTFPNISKANTYVDKVEGEYGGYCTVKSFIR